VEILMVNLDGFFADNLTPIVANVGALAIIAWVISIYSNRALTKTDGTPKISPMLVGVSFGFTASLLMFIPVELTPGLIADARGAPILLSGIIGGPIAALVTAIIAGVCRFLIGGLGYITGTLYVCVFALIGAAYWYAEKKHGEPRIGIVRLFLLASVATIISLPSVVFIPTEKQIPVLVTLWPILWVSSVIGTIILGTLLDRERKRVKNEYELAVQYERAEQATVAKSRFIAAMSHEIRTPLNAVLGILQLVDNDQIPEETRSKLKVAHNSGRFLLSLINQVLDFARIEANAIKPSRDTFTLSSLIDHMASIFKSQASAKGLSFDYEIADDQKMTPLVGSYAHIQQILFNFLGNAVKFTDNGGIKMRAELRKSEDGGLVAHFSVEDTGPGMSAEDIDIIFEEFGQAGMRATNKIGTGLGLSISKALSDALGGEILVDTSIGQGTTFSLLVPLEAGETENLVVKGQDQNATQGLKVLVAEDNDINQMIIRAMLEKDNHNVTLVDDGAKAVQAVQDAQAPFDLVLMDIQMPVMDGNEATRLIRELIPDGAKLPIVAVTANAFSDQRNEYLSAGMQDVVIKPIDASKLQAAIKSATAV
jgi:signal transduction histidine kinase/ActR/RegA family two-component response regulator